MTADSASPADQAPEPETPSEDPAEATKRKFREALESKKGRGGQDHLDEGQQSQVHAHGPVDSKRVFRRKTG